MAIPSDPSTSGPADGSTADPFRTRRFSDPSSSSAYDDDAPDSFAGSEAASELPADPFKPRGFTDPLSSLAGDSAPDSFAEGGAEAELAAGAINDSVRETARAAADAVRRQASRFVGDVGHELNETGETQKARGVDAIRGLARVIDGAADDLEPQSPFIAGAVHQAARGVESLSNELSSRNVSDLVDLAVRLARAQPALFIGGSVVAGFALARFLRSSAGERAARFDPYES